MKTIGNAHASGKVILLGEHAVVYGHGAIALPFEAATAKTQVSLSANESTLESQYYTGPLKSVPVLLEGLRSLIELTLKHLEASNLKFHFKIESGIPAQRGLGSSAAVSVTIVEALFDLFERKLDHDVLVTLVMHAERIHHINPSGLDVQVITGGNPIYFKRDQAPVPIEMNLSAYLVVIDSGIMGVTHEAISAVRELYELHPDHVGALLNRYGTITDEAVTMLKGNQVENLGKVMNEAQDILAQLGVSTREINKIVTIARASGALGAKLTGSGLGGCVIALCKTEVDARAIANIFHKAWVFNLKELAK